VDEVRDILGLHKDAEVTNEHYVQAANAEMLSREIDKTLEIDNVKE
jgi:hypothetical protein